METKYFMSRYNTIHKGAWSEIIKHMKVNAYDVIVPCELAVIFGGFFENPNAFGDAKTLMFYKTEDSKHGRYEEWVDILKKYFNKTVDLTGLGINESIKKIRSTVETYQS